MAPNDRKPSDPEKFGPGMKADGSVNLITPEQATIARAERDASEAAFDDIDGEEDDLSDLDDIGDIA